MQQLTKPPPPALPVHLRWLLALAILGNLLALWTVPWLPFGELGLHVQLLDIAARYNAAETAYRDWFVQPHLLDPGTLPLWFAHLLPYLNAWIVARLLLSAYVVALPLAVLALARALGRSPWLALFAVPLTWNALVNAGLLNALLAMPLLFWALALARRMATDGGLQRGILLGLTLVLLFFCHLVPFGLALISVVFLFVWYRRDLWSLTRLWVVLPTAPLLLQFAWRQLIAAQAAALRHLQTVDAPNAPERLPARALVDRLYDWTLLFFTDHADRVLAVALLAIWLTAWLVGLYNTANAHRGLLDPKSFERRMFGRRKWDWARVKRTLADGSLWTGAFDRRRLRWPNVQQWLREHGLEALTVLWALLYLALPSQYRGVPVVAELLPVPTLLLLSLWPRLHVGQGRAWLVVPLALVALGYGWQVRQEFARFDREEVGGLPEQLADLPSGPRFAYVAWQETSAVTYKYPLRHLPAGLVAAQHGGLMDDNPATQPQAILHFRKGMASVQLQRDFWLDPALMEVDFVLLRSGIEPTDAEDSGRIEHMWHGGHWWLYRVQHGNRDRIQVVDAGGAGGRAAYSDCPRGSVLQGLVAQPGPSALRSLVPLCQDLRTAKPATTPPEPEARLGTSLPAADAPPLLCPRGQYVVSLTGRIADYVSAVQVQCATAPWPGAQFALTPTRLVGGAGGKDFDVRCPEGTVGVGLQGRFGDVNDRVGLACAELATW